MIGLFTRRHSVTPDNLFHYFFRLFRLFRRDRRFFASHADHVTKRARPLLRHADIASRYIIASYTPLYSLFYRWWQKWYVINGQTFRLFSWRHFILFISSLLREHRHYRFSQMPWLAEIFSLLLTALREYYYLMHFLGSCSFGCLSMHAAIWRLHISYAFRRVATYYY